MVYFDILRSRIKILELYYTFPGNSRSLLCSVVFGCLEVMRPKLKCLAAVLLDYQQFFLSRRFLKKWMASPWDPRLAIWRRNWCWNPSPNKTLAKVISPAPSCHAGACLNISSLIHHSKLICCRATFESYANLQFHISLHSQSYEEEEKVGFFSHQRFLTQYY